MQMPSFLLHHYIKQKQSASYIEHKLQSESSKVQFCRSILQKTIACFIKTRFNLLNGTKLQSQCLQQLFGNVENVCQLSWFLMTFLTQRNMCLSFWTLCYLLLQSDTKILFKIVLLLFTLV